MLGTDNVTYIMLCITKIKWAILLQPLDQRSACEYIIFVFS